MQPHRERIDLGPTPYDRFVKGEGIPVLTGYHVRDIMEVELEPWERMGARGCYLNMADQQDTDAYVCEIAPGEQTLPQRHLFEAIVYVAHGQGATSVWQEGVPSKTFEWSAGAAFAIPLNASYQHFNVSGTEPVRLMASTTCPRLLNMFHNEDFLFRNPFVFGDRFRDEDDYFRANKRLATRCWETNLIPDVNEFALDDFPMKGKGVRIMRFTLADTTYGCHIQEFPVGSRSHFHRHGPGAILIVTEGEGYVMLWREGDARAGGLRDPTGHHLLARRPHVPRAFQHRPHHHAPLRHPRAKPQVHQRPLPQPPVEHAHDRRGARRHPRPLPAGPAAQRRQRGGVGRARMTTAPVARKWPRRLHGGPGGTMPGRGDRRSPLGPRSRAVG